MSLHVISLDRYSHLRLRISSSRTCRLAIALTLCWQWYSYLLVYMRILQFHLGRSMTCPSYNAFWASSLVSGPVLPLSFLHSETDGLCVFGVVHSKTTEN